MPTSVVTGATSGIGRWIAAGLAREGHDVVVIARDRQRAEALIGWIRQKVPMARLEWRMADLSSLAATAKVGADIVARHETIDLLVANAGVFCSRREETSEGHERVIAVNHLSPFVLTRALLPALRHAAAARIVYTGSSMSERVSIDPTDLEGRRRWGLRHTYGQSKLALTMTTIGWARRLQHTGIVANVVHPGVVATNLVRSGGIIGLGWRIKTHFALTEEQGADSPLHVALSPGYGSISGAYVKAREVAAPNPLALDDRLLEAVWQATETLVGVDPGSIPISEQSAVQPTAKSLSTATGSRRSG